MLQPGKPSIDDAFEGLRYLSALLALGARHNLQGESCSMHRLMCMYPLVKLHSRRAVRRASSLLLGCRVQVPRQLRQQELVLLYHRWAAAQQYSQLLNSMLNGDLSAAGVCGECTIHRSRSAGSSLDHRYRSSLC